MSQRVGAVKQTVVSGTIRGYDQKGAVLAKFYYGGQAVIEGVMMRGQRHMAVAVRAPDGRIVLHEEPLKGLLTHPAMKLPFLRGLLGLWDALGLGMKALMFAANVAMEEEEKSQGSPGVEESLQGAAATTALPTAPVALSSATSDGTTASREQSKIQIPKSKIESRPFSGPAAWTSILFALALMVGIFFVLPVLAASFITGLVGSHSNVAHNVIEGAIRLSLFIGYIWLIGRMPDIKRVFGYHGAEHKTINAYEAGAELTPERVRTFTLLNPRCGTTFLLIVLLLATLVFIVIGKLPFVLMVLSRIVLVPVIAAIAYEFIRLMANLYDKAIIRAIMAPGLALQKMTTREPDLTMLEVAIVALKAVLVADGALESEQAQATYQGEEAVEPVTTLA